jgi:TonB family protein
MRNIRTSIFALVIAAFCLPLVGRSQETPQPPQVPRAGENGVGVPLCKYCPIPEYTEEAKRANFREPVLLEAVVNVDGRASDISVLKPAAFGLEDRAVKALKSWRFKPARDAQHHPVAARTKIEITFRRY